MGSSATGFLGASVDYRNGTSADYGYSPRGDLTCHDWNFTGTAPVSCNTGAPELAYDFAYNNVGQLQSETVSDPLVALWPQAAGEDSYAVNGLNQYTVIGSEPAGGPPSEAPVVHDANGNTTTDHRGRTYAYSAENQLFTVHSSGGVMLAQNVYYADGNRRYYKSLATGTVVRRSFYDGDQEIAEYDALNTTLTRRYVRLPGSVDEPFLMIDYTLSAACTTAANGAAPCERWAHQNRLGSVVAVTSNAGAVLERHRYGPTAKSASAGRAASPSASPARSSTPKPASITTRRACTIRTRGGSCRPIPSAIRAE